MSEIYNGHPTSSEPTPAPVAEPAPAPAETAAPVVVPDAVRLRALEIIAEKYQAHEYRDAIKAAEAELSA